MQFLAKILKFIQRINVVGHNFDFFQAKYVKNRIAKSILWKQIQNKVDLKPKTKKNLIFNIN